MDTWARRLSLWTLLTLATLCSACGLMDQRRALVSPETSGLSKVQISKLTFLALNGKICNPELTPVCTIEMKFFEHDDGTTKTKYCVAVAPRIELKRQTGPNQQKRVVWELVPAALDGRPLAFHADSGIVIAWESVLKHVEKGGLGNGGGTPAVPTQYHMKVNRKEPALTKSSYLPVVLWGSAGNEELCAAVDPLIVNID